MWSQGKSTRINLFGSILSSWKLWKISKKCAIKWASLTKCTMRRNSLKFRRILGKITCTTTASIFCRLFATLNQWLLRIKYLSLSFWRMLLMSKLFPCISSTQMLLLMNLLASPKKIMLMRPFHYTTCLRRLFSVKRTMSRLWTRFSGRRNAR